ESRTLRVSRRRRYGRHPRAAGAGGGGGPHEGDGGRPGGAVSAATCHGCFRGTHHVARATPRPSETRMLMPGGAKGRVRYWFDKPDAEPDPGRSRYPIVSTQLHAVITNQEILR